MPLRVCVVMAHVGDHHAPRLCRLQDALHDLGGSLSVIQGQRASSFYLHKQSRRDALAGRLSIKFLKDGPAAGKPFSLWRSLSLDRPTHVIVLGYSDVLAVTSLAWANFHRRRIVFLSDSKADDQARSSGGEWIKSLLLKGFDGALVAGDRHRAYFRSLGFKGPMATGYDVVDNDYLAARAAAYRRHHSTLVAAGILPERLVLCVSRLVSRKRVDRAVEIFAASGAANDGHVLIIVGDGPEKPTIEESIERRNLQGKVRIIPSIETARMPLLYSRATALILASEYDQWGLCVNEAMACGVPAIVSDRCGVAGEIVLDHVNGIVFADRDISSAAAGLKRLCGDAEFHAAMAEAARRTIAGWSLDTYSRNLLQVLQDTSRLPVQTRIRP